MDKEDIPVWNNHKIPKWVRCEDCTKEMCCTCGVKVEESNYINFVPKDKEGFVIASDVSSKYNIPIHKVEKVLGCLYKKNNK